jgi:hypothetical protein
MRGTAGTRPSYVLAMTRGLFSPRAWTLFALLVILCVPSSQAQESSPQAGTSETTFHVSSNLVLVDVMALGSADGHPVGKLTRDDFQVSDNGHRVAIKTFDSGSAARPLVLWFLVQCSMKDWDAQGSGLFRGHIDLFEPALKDLDKQDTVAVAHWCDNGDAAVDLKPTPNLSELTRTLEQVLTLVVDLPSHNRPGELALQKALQHIVDATRESAPEAVPVVIFLYGDYSAMSKSEADHLIDELLRTSAIVFGIRDRQSPQIPSFWTAQGAVAKYIADQTGGQYLIETPETYAEGLKEILQQLHFRYELGFRPKSLDGKRHKLRVTLWGTAKDQNKSLRLRYRTAYVPIG